jgi:acyl carrier protein
MVSERLKNVILKELDLESFDIVDETLASQVPGWDSLSHVRILGAIEIDYGIRFKGLEVMRLRNVGQLQILVDAKLAAAK